MTEYQVNWNIDIEADNMDKAAMQARSIQLDPESIATFFNVSNKSNESVLVDTNQLKPVHFSDPTEQETYEDLLLSVHSILHDMIKEVDSKLLHLAKSGSGVLEAHKIALSEGKRYLEPRKVVLALLKEFERQQAPHPAMNTKQFKEDVLNYYRLI